MVTCREIVAELARIFTTCLSWVLMLPVAVLFLLRLLTGDRFWTVALFSNLALYCFLPLLCLVPLGLITRAKLALPLTLSLAVIGLIWFVPLFVTKSPPPANGTLLKVATFNVYRSNNQFAQVDRWLLETDADLIFLQEVPHRYIWLLLMNFTDIYPHFATSMPPQAEWGNVFLSRYPIQAIENVILANASTPNLVQRYRLDRNGQSLAAYNVYFAPPQGEPHMKLLVFNNYLSDYAIRYDETLRNQDAQRLLDRLADDELPFIVAGDFNLSEQSIFYNKLAMHMVDGYREAAGGLGATWPVQDILPGFVPPLLRVDYIWHSRDLRATAAWCGPKLGSDHLPVVAELEFTSTPSG